MTLALTPLISLIAGVLILVMPRLLNYIVAIYLIVIGLVGIFGTGNFNLNFSAFGSPVLRAAPSSQAVVEALSCGALLAVLSALSTRYSNGPTETNSAVRAKNGSR